jgi:hypothetical protein
MFFENYRFVVIDENGEQVTSTTYKHEAIARCACKPYKVMTLEDYEKQQANKKTPIDTTKN